MLRWHLLMSAMCHLWGPYCLIGPIVYSHVAVGVIWSAEVCCYYDAMWHVGGEVDLSWPATWHVGGAHMSGQCSGGAHIAEVDQWGADTWYWHAEVAQWGADTSHPLSLLWFYVCMFEIPNLHPVVYLSPSCTQMTPWLNLSPWSAYLICFIFFEFILIAPLIQKSWNFHQKSLNSWWSLL
jgi:hypothetical protein